MPANITTGVFSFSVSPVEATSVRNQSADGSFSQMLQGQMSARGETRMPDPARNAASMRAAAPEQQAQARETGRRDAASREPERSRDTERPRDPIRAAERQRSAGKSDRPEKQASPAQGGETKKTVGEALREATEETAASSTAPVTAESSPAAPASPGETGAVLAGLPAAIAALASKLAGPAEAEAPPPEELALDGGKPGPLRGLLTGDTPTKPSPDPAGSAALPQTAGADADANAGAKTNPSANQAAQLQIASPQTQIQARPDAGSAFAERQASALQALSGDAAVNLHGASTLATLRHQAGPQAAVPQLPVATPAGQSGWAEDVGNRVVWMLGRAESKAELVLTPPNMGRIEVSINLNGDQTTAQFVASSQAARDALEQALPRLREMLQQSGINLGQANVSTSGEQQASSESHGGSRNSGAGQGGSIDTSGTGSAPVWIRQQEGMVDIFA